MLTEKDKNLYDRDYNLWQQQAIAALKNRDSERLDWHKKSISKMQLEFEIKNNCLIEISDILSPDFFGEN